MRILRNLSKWIPFMCGLFEERECFGRCIRSAHILVSCLQTIAKLPICTHAHALTQRLGIDVFVCNTDRGLVHMCVCSYHGLWNVLHVYSCICIPCDINHAHDTTEHNTMRGPRHKREMPNCLQGLGWPVVGKGERVGVTFRESARERARERKGKKSVNAGKETTTDGGAPTQLAPIFIYIPPWPQPLLCCIPHRDPHGQLSHRQKCRVAFFQWMRWLFHQPLASVTALSYFRAARRCNRICLTSLRRKCGKRWDECIRN